MSVVFWCAHPSLNLQKHTYYTYTYNYIIIIIIVIIIIVYKMQFITLTRVLPLLAYYNKVTY